MSRHWCHKFLTLPLWQNTLIIKYFLLCNLKGRVKSLLLLSPLALEINIFSSPSEPKESLTLCKGGCQMLVLNLQPMTWGVCLLCLRNGPCISWLMVSPCRMSSTVTSWCVNLSTCSQSQATGESLLDQGENSPRNILRCPEGCDFKRKSVKD